MCVRSWKGPLREETPRTEGKELGSLQQPGVWRGDDIGAQEWLVEELVTSPPSLTAQEEGGNET